MSRKIADCRKYPSESNCSLTISGEEDEVLRAAEDHAVSVHGHERGPELRAQLRSMLEDEPMEYRGARSSEEQPVPVI